MAFLGTAGNFSHNFPSLHDFGGQNDNHNVFFQNASNIELPSSSPDDAVIAAFQAMLPLLPGGPLDRPVAINNMPEYENAAVRSDGSLVQTIVAPFQLTLVPNPKLAIPANTPNDFRVDVANTVMPGDVIFTVMVRRDENSTVYETVGDIVCDSYFIASAYGDGPLFFPSSQPSLATVVVIAFFCIRNTDDIFYTF